MMNIAIKQIELRNSRQVDFIPASEQARLAKARILLAGCGAGSTLAPNLARIGYASDKSGFLIFADPDVVDITNLNRQAFSESAIGSNKAQALQDEVQRINSGISTRVVADGITTENVAGLVAEAEVIVDMIDVGNPAIMLVLHREAQRQKKPVVSGFDLGEGTATFVCDYRSPSAMTLDQLLGLKNISPEDLIKLPPIAKTALAAQCLMGPVANIFANQSEVEQYYGNFFKSRTNIKNMKSIMPLEMHLVIDSLIEGKLKYIPQMNTASAALGNIHEAIVRNLLLGNKVKVIPDIIRTDMKVLISPGLSKKEVGNGF